MRSRSWRARSRNCASASPKRTLRKDNLECIAGDKCAGNAAGKNVGEEVGGAVLRGSRSVVGNIAGVEGGRIDVHSRAGAKQESPGQTGDQRQRGNNLEIDESLDSNSPNLLEIAKARDAAVMLRNISGGNVMRMRRTRRSPSGRRATA